jgi:glycosidase
VGWWGLKSLPKFNTDNPAVRRFLLDVGRYWIEQGADGWRLDVPNEIDDDTFWDAFRQTVKAVNRDAYLLGEIWTADPRWVGPRHFDGLIDYPLRDAILGFLEEASLTATQFAGRVENLLAIYPRENTYAMYLTLGSHDTERLYTILKDNLEKVKLAYAILFALPGAPSIYYGDEIGMTGGKDPDSRGAFPWDKSQWNWELRGWLQRLITVRKELPALRRGQYQRLLADDRLGGYAFARSLGDQPVLALFNASPTPCTLRVPVAALGWKVGRGVRGLLGDEKYLVSGESLAVTLPAWGAAWIG